MEPEYIPKPLIDCTLEEQDPLDAPNYTERSTYLVEEQNRSDRKIETLMLI
jgi:hypothetical protein